MTTHALKYLSLVVCLTAALAIGLACFHPAGAAEEKPSQLRHVVAFKFKQTATAEQIKKVEDAFLGLPKKIGQIQAIEWGTNNSPEKLNKGCTPCFLLTFRSDKDRDDYLVHPAHKEFGGLVGPLLDDVFVIDYYSKTYRLQ
jgi:hypothetical protein